MKNPRSEKVLKTLSAIVEEKMTNKDQVLGMIQSTATDLQDKARKYFRKRIKIKNFLLPEKAGSTLTVHIGTNCSGSCLDEPLDNYVNVTPIKFDYLSCHKIASGR